MKTQNKLCLVLIVFAAFILNGCEDGNGSTTEINASESISEKAPAPVSIEIKSFTVAPESVEKGHGVKICWEATPVDVLVEIVDSKGAKIATKTMEVQEKEEKASEASLINVKTSVVSLLSGKVIEEDNAEVKEEKKDSNNGCVEVVPEESTLYTITASLNEDSKTDTRSVEVVEIVVGTPQASASALGNQTEEKSEETLAKEMMEEIKKMFEEELAKKEEENSAGIDDLKAEIEALKLQLEESQQAQNGGAGLDGSNSNGSVIDSNDKDANIEWQIIQKETFVNSIASSGKLSGNSTESSKIKITEDEEEEKNIVKLDTKPILTINKIDGNAAIPIKISLIDILKSAFKSAGQATQQPSYSNMTKMAPFKVNTFNEMERKDDSILLAGVLGGMMKSTDGGDTWTMELPMPILNYEGSHMSCYGKEQDLIKNTDKEEIRGYNQVCDIEIIENRVIVAFDDGISYSDTPDDIFSWHTWNNDKLDPYEDYKTNWRVFNALEMYDGVLYAGTSDGIYTSESGEAWSNDNGGSLSSSIDVYRLASGDSKLYAGTNNGLMIKKSTTGDWEKVESCPIQTIQALAVKDKTIVVGDGELHISTDGGDTWKNIHNENMGMVNDISITEDGIIYVATENGLFSAEIPE